MKMSLLKRRLSLFGLVGAALSIATSHADTAALSGTSSNEIDRARTEVCQLVYEPSYPSFFKFVEGLIRLKNWTQTNAKKETLCTYIGTLKASADLLKYSVQPNIARNRDQLRILGDLSNSTRSDTNVLALREAYRSLVNSPSFESLVHNTQYLMNACNGNMEVRENFATFVKNVVFEDPSSSPLLSAMNSAGEQLVNISRLGHCGIQPVIPVNLNANPYEILP